MFVLYLQIIFNEKTEQIIGLSQNGRKIYEIKPGNSHHLVPKFKPKIINIFESTKEILRLTIDDKAELTIIFKDEKITTWEHILKENIRFKGIE